MRRVAGVAAALAAVAIAASGCLGTGAAAPTTTCAGTARPSVALATRLDSPPPLSQARCLARSQSSIFGDDSWGAIPKQMHEVNPGIALWQARSLLYACNTCSDAVFSVTWMTRHHPDWILRTAGGDEIHPVGQPQKVLLNFSNYDYQDAWANRVVSALASEHWTGVDVIDANNDPQWTGVPEGLSANRAYALGEALQDVRAVVKTGGFRLAARNGPPSIVDVGQLNSTDLVGVDEGFADLKGAAWTQLFQYFKTAFDYRVGAIVWDDEPGLDRAQRVYGLASYFLIQDALSVYGAYNPLNPLYRISLGDRTDGVPEQQGAAWVRKFDTGSVAVNPSAQSVKVTLSGHADVTLPPGSAVILAGSRIISSW